MEKGQSLMKYLGVQGVNKIVTLILVIFAIGISGVFCPSELSIKTAEAQVSGKVPGNWSGSASDAEIWRAVRKGVTGTVSIPDKKAAQLVQSDADNWRAFKNGPMSQFGGFLLLGVFILLGLFYVARGKIMIEGGASGQTVERFNGIERFTHWLTASSFIVLSLTGLNILYGRYILKPILGPEIFATVTEWGKISHNFIAFAFLIGIILMFFLWVKDNIPNKHDLKWLAMGGGMFTEGVHPPAKRFNAGQKMIFWIVIIGGGSLTLSGLALMFPFEIQPWAGTFSLFNNFGLNLPTILSPLQETQLSVLWHSVMSLLMIAVIIAHIYIGSVGMEGAIEAMGDGQVDKSWAKSHHNLWFEEVGNKTIKK